MTRRLWTLGAGILLACLSAAPIAADVGPCWRGWLVAVERVLAGDTFDAEIQVWPRVTITERVGVLGVETPEPLEIERWRAAREFTIAWLKDAGATTVTACRYDNRGRVLGSVVSFTKGELSAALITAGYGGGARRDREPGGGSP